jgi:hypothetical protein
MVCSVFKIKVFLFELFYDNTSVLNHVRLGGMDHIVTTKKGPNLYKSVVAPQVSYRGIHTNSRFAFQKPN